MPGLAIEPKKRVETQARKYRQSISTRILMMDNTAYWIDGTTVYTASIINDEIDQDNKKPIDTMGMNDVELKRIMFIVDKLTEGLGDDRSNHGK